MPLSTLPTGTERVVVLALDEALRATIHETLAGARLPGRSCGGRGGLAGGRRRGADGLLMIEGSAAATPTFCSASAPLGRSCASSQRSIPAARPSASKASGRHR